MTTAPPFILSRAAFLNENDGLYRKKWTAKECQFLVDSGLLEPGKFELLDGEIIYKIGQSIEHRACVTGIVATVSKAFDLLCIQSQGGVAIGDWDEYNTPNRMLPCTRSDCDSI
ncbi:MAG: hypothetical protein H7145_02185 [Akkermansiaceae bacterium]|nr:hypothetical protein [Armatimonadota bacterium]